MGRKQRTSRQSPQPSDPDEELDLSAFSEALHPSGLSIRDVNNDGNCFFRAVSDQLYGSEEHHMKLRELACDYLQRNKDHYKHFVDDEQTFDDYVTDMRNDGVWADNLELQAISMALSVNIRVHQSGKPSYDIRNHLAKDAQVIHLSYHFSEHYASVRPLDTAELAVPAQHPPLPPPKSPAVEAGEDAAERHRRRPRRKLSFEIDGIGNKWKRAYRHCCDLCSLVEKTRRVARNIKSAHPVSPEEEERHGVAKRIDRDMKNARDQLEHVSKRINDGKMVHVRTRTRKKRFGWDDTDGKAGALASLPGIGGEKVRYDEEHHYWDHVRVETENIFDILNRLDEKIRESFEVIFAVAKEANNRGGTSRMLKGSKKKEQEAKKKERKEKRRKEQESLARGDSNELYTNELARRELGIVI